MLNRACAVRLTPLLVLAIAAGPLAAQASVFGRVSVTDKGGRPAEDVGQSVVWLTGARAEAGRPVQASMATEGKQFLPHLVVAPVGSTIAFPNHDGFKHNVFSLSPEGTFDLGLYGRGEGRTHTFGSAGIIRVYCNVHAQMRGIVRVVPSGLWTKPAADGAFRISEVPPGEYTLHVWHERAAEEVTQNVVVREGEDPSVVVILDARGYQQVQHRNKNGKPYESDRSRRY
jgi:plastocyanin